MVFMDLPLKSNRWRAFLGALAVAVCWGSSGTTAAQQEPIPGDIRIPAAPAADVRIPEAPGVPGIATGAARSIQGRLNSEAAGAVPTLKPGQSSVLLGSGVEATAPRSGGFMQPTFAPLPGKLMIPPIGGSKFHSGQRPPGFFTWKGDGRPTVKGLYTAPNEQDPYSSITP